MAIYVKSHRRGKSLVKAYKRDVERPEGRRSYLAGKLQKKYLAGYNALGGSRGMGKEGYIRGFDPKGFILRTVRRARRRG